MDAKRKLSDMDTQRMKTKKSCSLKTQRKTKVEISRNCCVAIKLTSYKTLVFMFLTSLKITIHISIDRRIFVASYGAEESNRYIQFLLL